MAFTRRVGRSGRFVEEMLRLCDRLVDDPEDLVRKGVGWALKDGFPGAPDRVRTYVQALRRRGAPAVVTLYAVRGLPPAERAAILAIRPEHKKRRNL